MIIDVDDIKEQGLVLEAIEPHDRFPVLAELQRHAEAVFVEPLDLRVTVRRLEDMVVVAGTVGTRARFQCCRCLKEFEEAVEVSFSVTFSHQYPHMEWEDEDGDAEVELQAEDLGMISYEGDEIDLTEAVQEQVVMALPIKPLCSKGCRGLCGQCGADLNEGDCGCSEQPLNGKFAALKDFKVKKKD